MSNKRFETTAGLLEAKRAEIMRNLERRDGIQIEHAPDALDAIQNLMQREFAVDQIDRESRLLRQVEEALRRIEHGSYGICADCEDEISARRLAAVPWASLCIRCQQEADRSSTQSGAHAFHFDFAAAA